MHLKPNCHFSFLHTFPTLRCRLDELTLVEQTKISSSTMHCNAEKSMKKPDVSTHLFNCIGPPPDTHFCNIICMKCAKCCILNSNKVNNTKKTFLSNNPRFFYRCCCFNLDPKSLYEETKIHSNQTKILPY